MAHVNVLTFTPNHSVVKVNMVTVFPKHSMAQVNMLTFTPNNSMDHVMDIVPEGRWNAHVASMVAGGEGNGV